MNNELNIVASTVPAVITVNYDDLKSSLTKELEQYDVVVTADTVASTKKLATELNKLRSQIDERRKAIMASASEPIRVVDDQLRELMKMCSDGRKKLTSQVEQFDKERIDLAFVLKRELLSKTYEAAGISEQFRTLVPSKGKMTDLTAKGALSAQAKREIEDLVATASKSMDRYDARVNRLATISETVGLKAPLAVDDVQHILMIESEVEYDKKLNAIIDRAVNRERMADQVEADKTAEVEQKADETIAAIVDQPAEPQVEVQHEKPAEVMPKESPVDRPKLGDNKEQVSVICTFKTRVHPLVLDSAIEQEMRRVITEKAGLTTLASVRIERHTGE